MIAITHSQVQELVQLLPAKKMPLAFNLLTDLAKKEEVVPSPLDDFMLLPLSERRRIMAQQALQMVAHYEQSQAEREAWQGGDFVDED